MTDLLDLFHGKDDQGFPASHRDVLLTVMEKPSNQADIARRLAMSSAHVNAAVHALKKQGILKVGREVSLAPEVGEAVAVGVDLGFNHTTVIARRVDRPFDQVVEVRNEFGARRQLSKMLGDISDLIDEALAGTGLPRERVLSAGVAVPRMIDPRTGTFTAPILPPWKRDDRPEREVSKLLGITAVMDNDANLGALAEQAYGDTWIREKASEGTSEKGKRAETVIFVKASTGIGAGIMIGNSLFRGRRGMAGEIGHLTIDREGVVCHCGGRGCLETIIGGDALLAQVLRWKLPGSPDLPTLRALVDHAREGDAVCRRVVQDAGRTLGLGLAQLCTLLNPEIIVLGGPLADAGDMMLDRCRETLLQYAMTGTVDQPVFDLRTASLGQLSEAQGALILGLRSLLSKI